MKPFLSCLLLILLVCGCSNEPDPNADRASFTRIYDSNTFSTAFTPIDVRPTAEGGYLILAGRKLPDTQFTGIYLLKVDAFGAVMRETTVAADLVNPVGDLLPSGDRFFFFAMNPVSLQAFLVEVSADGELLSQTAVPGSYPAAAAADGNQLVLLSYDNVNRECVLSFLTTSGTSVRAPKGFSIGAGDAVEAPVIQHFLRTGRQFPFRVGRIGNRYYYNGFFNYTFSLIFTDLSDNAPGVVQGQQSNGGFSELLLTGDNAFAAARFNFGDNYILPRVSLNTTGISSATDLGGNPVPELVPNATVKAIAFTLRGRAATVFASTTRNRQIVLYAYDRATGELLGSRYIGFSNAFEAAAVVATPDGGLAVCGTTYLASRFPRLVLVKISEAQVAQAFGTSN